MKRLTDDEIFEIDREQLFPWGEIPQQYKYDLLDAQLAKLQPPEDLRETIKTIIKDGVMVFKDENTPTGSTELYGIEGVVGSIISLIQSLIQQARADAAREVEAMLSFTVRINGNTVVIDKHDWDNFWQTLKSRWEGEVSQSERSAR